jgi:hypothetical protein
MARKYEYRPGHYGWALEKSEEDVLIAAYEEIRPYIPPAQIWKVEFESHYYDYGDGVTAEFLDQINATRKRRRLDVITIRETEVYEYARSSDRPFKADRRRRFREEFNSANEKVRQRRIETAKAEMAMLPAPSMTFEEWKSREQRHKSDSFLSREEIIKRSNVQREATASLPKIKPTLPVERAVRMLELGSPNVWGEIISRLSPDDALAAAEQVSDVELRDALIQHSLGA